MILYCILYSSIVLIFFSGNGAGTWFPPVPVEQPWKPRVCKSHLSIKKNNMVHAHCSWFVVLCYSYIRAHIHYRDVIMNPMAYQITSLTIVYSTVHSSADQRKYQSSASLAFVRGIHRGPVNSPHKWPVTRKKFPFDDVTSLVLGQSYDCPSTREATLKDIGKWITIIH